MMIAFLFAQIMWATAQNSVSEVTDQFRALNSMRESLAATLDPKAAALNEGTFKAVCVPVGQKLKAWSESKGYVTRQIARKNRNPAHVVTSQDEAAYGLFEKDQTLMQKVVPMEWQGQRGEMIYGRIPVVAACLHCHGSRDTRPDFIVKKYAQDKAYGFQVGELRGLYAVFRKKSD